MTCHTSLFIMLSVRLTKQLEEQLETLAKVTNRPKSFFVKDALEGYLEDMLDYYEAEKRQQNPKRSLISLEELERSLAE